jgi:membrane-associated protease RseP (regulator of RpoE activity)
VLLVASAITTTANGARFMQNFLAGLPAGIRDGDLWPWGWLADHPHRFASGFAFSFTLLGILLIHEFGHYLACRVHRIKATLPWVLPAPTLSGTAGAVIQIRSAIPNRDALMDVGIYGPLAGYAASLLALTGGFFLSHTRQAGAPAPLVRFGTEPLTLRLLHRLLVHWDPSIPSFTWASPHPVLLAGWIGLFITSLNLLPAGQLDGGHILYAIAPRVHKAFTLLLPALLFLAGLRYWAGWILWGLLLLLPAMRHPRIPLDSKLSRGRIVLAVAGALIFLLTFTPTPFHDVSLLQLLR